MATPIPVTEKCNTAAIVAVVFLMRFSEGYGRVETKVSQVSAGQLFLFETIANEFYSKNSKINSEVDLENINKTNISDNRLVGMNDIDGYSVINNLRKTTTQSFQSPQSVFHTYWWKQRKTIIKCKLKSRILTTAKDTNKNNIIKRVKRGRNGIKIKGKPLGSISDTMSTARRKSFKNARSNIHEVKTTRLAFDKINSELSSLKLISLKHFKTNFYDQNKMLDKSTALKLIIKNVTIKNNILHKDTSIRSTHNLKTGTAKQRLRSKATNKQKAKSKTLINSTDKGYTPKNRLKSNKSMSANTTGLSTEILPKIGVTTRPFEILPGGYFKYDEKDNYYYRTSKPMRGVTPYIDKSMRNNSQADIFKDMYMVQYYINGSEISENGKGYDDYQDQSRAKLPRYNLYNDYDIGSGYYDFHSNYSYGIKNEIYNILVFNFFTSTEFIPLDCPTVPKTTTLCPVEDLPPDLIREKLLFDYNVVVTAAVTGFTILMISLCICLSCGTYM